ncbi:hypothetical protein H2203_003532 [Taxawa tesnikishii (nom. ined.)]|nr:hypothetical protein H2203_003532 [Dothideales sp. JES 119]
MAETQPEALPFLLLLPPAPSPPDAAALKAAFGDTLVQVLKEVESAAQESTGPAFLEIALACPHLVGHASQARSQLYGPTQHTLAALYKLVCVIAAKENVNIEDADGVDVRILLVAWSPAQADQASSQSKAWSGPIIDLDLLAGSQRPYQYAFGVESEQGEAFVRAFIQAKQSGAEIHRAPGGPVMSSAAGASFAQEGSGRIHEHVAVGGTFDHIHIGHKLLLTMTAFAVDNRERSSPVITIGITGDELLKNKKHAEQLESWHDRQQSVYRFLRSLVDFSPPGTEQPSIQEVKEEGPNGHAVNTTFPSGLTLKHICTHHFRRDKVGGKAVNDKRAEKGWPTLEVFEVDVLDAEEAGESAENEAQTDFQSKISSTEIRRKLSEKAKLA